MWSLAIYFFKRAEQVAGQLRRADPDERTREHVSGIMDAGVDSGVTDQRRQGQ
jgi:hypothetical protein